MGDVPPAESCEAACIHEQVEKRIANVRFTGKGRRLRIATRQGIVGMPTVFPEVLEVYRSCVKEL
ncbi:MAG: hypothetical protein Q4D60_02595 [Eubacteriales bacterium]|nr:hypothetical protein [Eubacteriales bacterium]